LRVDRAGRIWRRHGRRRALVTVHAGRGDQVQRKHHRAVHAEVEQARCVCGQQQAQRDEAEHHHAKGGSEQVRGAGGAVHRLLALHRIDDDEEQQVEDAGTQHIADRQIRLADPCHRADARGQLRQRGHRGQEDQSHPALTPAVVAGQALGTAAEHVAGTADGCGASQELRREGDGAQPGLH
jgi:hypothetical protein